MLHRLTLAALLVAAALVAGSLPALAQNRPPDLAELARQNEALRQQVTALQQDVEAMRQQIGYLEERLAMQEERMAMMERQNPGRVIQDVLEGAGEAVEEGAEGLQDALQDPEEALEDLGDAIERFFERGPFPGPGPRPSPGDPNEPNDDTESATFVNPGSSLMGSVGMGDVDFFVTYGAPGSSNTVALDFIHARGDVDCMALDANGQQLAASLGVTDHEEMQVVTPEDGRFFVQVFGGGEGNDYTISLTDASAVSGRENATEVGIGYEGEGQVGAGTDDWYLIRGSPADAIRVTIDFQHSRGDVDCEAQRASGATLTGSYGTSNQEILLVEVPEDGLFYVKVYGFGGAMNDYAIHVEAAGR